MLFRSYCRYEQSFKRIESEIVPAYLEGCIHWVDTIYDGAWSAIMDRFEKKLALFLDGKIRDMDYEIEEDMMLENLKSYMQKYRTYKRLDEKAEFLKGFEKEKKYEF